MNVETFAVGIMPTNCYVLTDDSGLGLIVDPAAPSQKLSERIDDFAEGQIKYILLTHGHFDHIGAANEVREHYGIKIYASCDEEKLLASPARNLSNAYGMSLRVTADVLHNDGDILELAGLKIKAIHTPGHTKGSCCYYIEEEDVLFSGDTVFYGSVGRTDFPGGSTADIVRSLHKLVDSLPEETEVFPGHDASTTIGYEKRYNPFV